MTISTYGSRKMIAMTYADAAMISVFAPGSRRVGATRAVDGGRGRVVMAISSTCSFQLVVSRRKNSTITMTSAKLMTDIAADSPM